MATLLSDSFTDTNGVGIASHKADIPNTTGWVVTSTGGGTATIQTNKLDSGAATASQIIVWDVAQADVIQSADCTWATISSTLGLSARLSDANNYWRTRCATGTTGNWKIQEVVAGSSTDRATGSVTVNTGSTHTISVTWSGTSVTATIDGGNTISFTPTATGNSNTKFGTFGFTTIGADHFQFDNYLITSAVVFVGDDDDQPMLFTEPVETW